MIYPNDVLKNIWANGLMDALVEGRPYVGHLGDTGYSHVSSVFAEFIEQQGGALNLEFQANGGRIIVHLIDSGDRNVWN